MTERKNFWDVVPAAAFKNMAEISRETGIHEPGLFAVKSGDRGLSADNARKVAELDGDKRKSAYFYLASQTAALSKKVATKKISDEGVLRSAGIIMRTATKGFRPDEVNRFDSSFRKVALELKAIAETALEMVPDDANAEPIHAKGDSVAPALKTATKGSTRDAYGKAIPKGDRIERDVHGRRVYSD